MRLNPLIYYRSNGETDGSYTVNYALLTNACILPPGNQIQVFGSKGQSVALNARKITHTPDFYFSPIESMNEDLIPMGTILLYSDHVVLVISITFLKDQVR